MDSSISGRDQNDIRLTRRRACELAVEIYCHGYPFTRGKICGIGPDGIRVTPHTPVRDSQHALIEVEFSLQASDAGRRCRLPVFMGRRDADRSSGEQELIFSPMRPDVLQAFQNEYASVFGPTSSEAGHGAITRLLEEAS